MNLNEIIWQILRSGFPLLILVLYGILIYNVWKNEAFTSKNKWKWIAIIVVPGLLTLGLFFLFINMDSDNLRFMNILFIMLLFLPFSGVLAWLVGTR